MMLASASASASVEGMTLVYLYVDYPKSSVQVHLPPDVTGPYTAADTVKEGSPRCQRRRRVGVVSGVNSSQTRSMPEEDAVGARWSIAASGA